MTSDARAGLLDPPLQLRTPVRRDTSISCRRLITNSPGNQIEGASFFSVFRSRIGSLNRTAMGVLLNLLLFVCLGAAKGAHLIDFSSVMHRNLGNVKREGE